MPVVPVPCTDCPGGAGGSGPGVENVLLCDVDADGNVVGAALAVYEYDQDGNPIGAPTFVDPVTGDPYEPTGTLQPCPAAQLQIGELVLCDSTGARFLRAYVRDASGAVVDTIDTDLDGAPFLPVAPVAVCNIDAVTYQSAVVDVTAAPLTVNPGTDLVSITVRNRDATTATLEVNGGGALPLDPGEAWSSDLSGGDPNEVLDDTVTVDPGDGTVRVTTVRRT